MTGPVNLDDLLTNDQAASLLSLKPTTLEIWRIRSKGPPFIKLGEAKQAPVRYLRSEVMNWLAQRSFASTSAYSSQARTSGKVQSSSSSAASL